MTTWQQLLQNAISSLPELLQQLDLSYEHMPKCLQQPDFPLRVPQPFVDRIKKGDPNDPLLRQILAIDDESQITSGYTNDPLAEKHHNPIPGLLHKYHGRVLITATGHCAINCRYCFRRLFPYQDNNPGQKGWEKIIEYIQQRKEIKEVILSGGDPLNASDNLLNKWIKQIETIDHVNTLRIHSRLPIVIPQRMTESLLQSLKDTSLNIVLVIHCNHAQEIDQLVEKTLIHIKHAGITLLNQSVLLKNVNDDAETLIALSERLFNCGVMPYYLHCLDPVQGTAHFAITLETTRKIMHEVAKKLPGYLVPKLVREQAFSPYKLPVS